MQAFAGAREPPPDHIKILAWIVGLLIAAESKPPAEPGESPSLAVWSARPIFDLQAL